MKNHVKIFCQRGLIAMGGGPIIMAIVYWILNRCGVVEYLSVYEVVRGIFSTSLMAFIAAGISMVYTIDRLPLMGAISVHFGVLYLDYILFYLLNGWLKQQLMSILIFTISFVAGYAIIWLSIWLGIKKNTNQINTNLKKR